MRLSTSMIFENSVSAMQTQSTALLHTQQQVATGRKMVTAADDPAAAAQVLQVQQAQAVNKQYSANQASAKSTLGLVDGQLQSVDDLIQYVQGRAVEAGNGAYNASDLNNMAIDIQGQFEQLMGLANVTDGLGQFLFSGNKGGTQPFRGDMSSGVTYHGDQGGRALQVSSSRQLQVSSPGDTLFMGNPYVSVAASGATSSSVTSSSVDVAGALTGHDYQIQVDSSGTYSVFDTGTSSTTPIASGSFTSGAAIQFDGVSITLTGAAPGSGTDTFDVKTGTPGVFDILSNLNKTLQNPTTGDPAAHTTFQTQIQSAIGNLTSALDSVLNVRSAVGSRMNEAAALATASSGLDNQYAQILSDLQDTDYTEALTQLSQQQIGLQAAQKSFLQVSGLSLFNYMS